MPLGLTPVLATFTGQVASWQLQDLSSAISAYAGTTARVVFRYESGSSYTGDLQLDAITLGGTTAGFESGIDSYQTSTTSDGGTSTYSSVTSWTSLATTAFQGRWNRWTGNTPSADTGDLGAYAGSYFVYAETTTLGYGYPSKYFWLRGPEIVVTPATFEFALGRQGATIGTLKVYLAIASNVTISFSGWGRSGWGEQAFGEGSASLVATGSVGSVTVQEGVGVYVTGVQATATLGNIAVNADGAISALGNAATGEVGTVEIDAGAIVAVTGVVGTTALGTAGVQGSVIVNVTGVAGTTVLGTVSVTADAIVTETGLQGTTALGSVTVELVINVDVTGVQGTTALGETTEAANADVYAIGVQATGQVGTVLVWSQIVPGGNPNWTEIIAA
jgi:hypothetical protein